MNRLYKMLFVTPLALSGVVGGCGDSDGDSGVSSGRKISELTDADVQALCKEEMRRGEKAARSVSKEEVCAWAGLQSEEFGFGSCEETRDACLGAEAEEPEDEESEDPEDPCAEASTTDLPDCGNDLTVGQWRKCQDAIYAAASAVYKGLTCDSELSDLGDETPEACKEIEQKCPELLDI